MKFKIILILFILILFNSCNLNEHNFSESKKAYDNQWYSPIDKINYSEIRKINKKKQQKIYNENYNLSYIAKMKNYSYPIKIAIIEFQLPNTNYSKFVYNNGMGFLEILNNKEKDSFNLLGFTENELVNTYFGYMKQIDYIKKYRQKFSNINSSFLKYEDLFTFPLKYSEIYFKNEYKRINNTLKDIIKIETFGPYKINSIINRGRGNNQTQIKKFKNLFDKEINKTRLNLSSYDVISIVFFDDGRFGHKAFVPFADVKNSKFYVNFFVGNFENGLQTFIHELTHILGASDKYDYNSGIAGTCLKSGLANPKKFGGDIACLMCGTIQKNDSSGLVPNYLAEVKICNKTAKEIGWIK